ncbi:MAG: hypothetical protein JNK82_17225 [Myxococcaceae bacterium]|nr:hypothetical protein [Myxococcaceae bacterium]
MTARLRPGDTFGDYQLDSRLGVDGMAEVWVAHPLYIDRQNPFVVLKRMHQHLSEDDRVLRMFLDEARLSSRLNHPNVVKVLDSGEVKGDAFIVMGLIDGRVAARLSSARELEERLREFLDEHRPPTAADIGGEVAMSKQKKGSALRLPKRVAGSFGQLESTELVRVESKEPTTSKIQALGKGKANVEVAHRSRTPISSSCPRGETKKTRPTGRSSRRTSCWPKISRWRRCACRRRGRSERRGRRSSGSNASPGSRREVNPRSRVGACVRRANGSTE